VIHVIFVMDCDVDVHAHHLNHMNHSSDAWETLYSDVSRPFDKPKSGRIAVKVINHLGDEVMKVFGVG